MIGRATPDTAKAEAGDALTGARQKARPAPGLPMGVSGALAMQRSAGNSAVSALMAARLRQPGEQAVTAIDAALVEVRGDNPSIETVEKGLRAAKDAGVPVELEGPKPPASALAVVRTGFGPASVEAKKPVPPPKAVPAVTALTRATAKPTRHAAPGRPGPSGREPVSDAGPSLVEPSPTVDRLQPPTAPAHRTPHTEPGFRQVASHVRKVAHTKKSHPPAAATAKAAQAAALAPTDDLAGQAKAAKADSMDARQPGTFDKKAFITAVKSAIEAKSPKTLKEADDYQESGKAGEVKGEVKGLVTQGKDGQAKDITAATEAPPDPSTAVAKPVTPIVAENPGAAEPLPASGAAIKPAPADQLNLAAGPQRAEQELADADVSEPQLAQSGEPQFEQALADKQAAQAHSATAPGEFRQHEGEVIGQQKTQADAEATAGVTGMHGAKGAALAKLAADQGSAKGKDEAKRAEVTGRIQAIFNATETDVQKILTDLDPKVDAAFEQGEAAARKTFETYTATKMAAYKDDRYSGWLGGLRWAKDKLLGMPDKVNEFYEAGRELYLKQMDTVISGVADIVGRELTAAKTRIASGRAEIARYVTSLPTDLQKIGSQASQEIGEKFEQLENDVNAKQEAVVDTLATKYVESRKGLDERIEALQAENKGLVDQAIGAIKGVINTIRELVKMLGDVLSRAAGVVGDIIKKPVEFLGNLIAGIKGGIEKFKDNIVDHLRKGLLSWLFGALAEGGVELPGTFDPKGIVKLLGSIFGLTWANIRNRLVKQIGEKAMAVAEKGVGIFQTIAREGISGLWHMFVEKLGDIKEMIMEQVKDFVITKIITAGITWLIGLLNPAAAFIKACKLIYDVVMFFVNNASRIMKFVNTVLDSVADIVRGNVGGVVDKINDVLGQMVPIIIGFLASLLGLGGIGAKIRSIIETLQKPVNKALDFVIKTGLKLAGPLIRGFKSISGKVKSKVAAGKTWVKGKADAGRAALASVRDWFTLRKVFTAKDGAGHSLYWTGRGATARLTVASSPTPVDAVLAQAGRMIKSGHPQYGDLQAARAQQNQILAIKAVVEQAGPGGRQPADVDRLNNAMEVLTTLLAPLVPVVFPATAPAAAGTLPTWVQPFRLVKLTKENRTARVLSVDRTDPRLVMVQYQIIRPRLRDTDGFHAPEGGRTGAAEKVSAGIVNSQWAEFVADPRNLYMGPTPSKTSPVGQAVMARMRAEGRLVGDQVRYGRSAAGVPLPPGQFELHPVSQCAMGHIIDAVTWWNTNGRFTGPQSPEVQAFMTDPANYEIEPGGPNSLRGAQLGGRGGRYQLSTK